MKRKKLSSFRDGDETIIVIGDHEPPKSIWRRIFHWLGEIILWVIAVLPGLLIIRYGVGAIVHKRILSGKWVYVTHYGDDAIGEGWLFVSFGFWVLGQGFYLKTSRPFTKFIFNIVASIAFIIGIWFLMKRFV